MSGALHTINGFKIRWEFDDKIRIIRPNGTEIWTNSFNIVREMAQLKK